MQILDTLPKMKHYILPVATILIFALSCKNKDINESEELEPKVIHDIFKESDFTRITIDGVEYVMLEKDNNNPHEGFGFMAFKANKLFMTTDSILAYLRVMNHFQIKMYARTMQVPESAIRTQFDSIFFANLKFGGIDKSSLLSNDKVQKEESINSSATD